MAEQELMRKRFSAVSVDAAVRFGTNEVRVGAFAPDFELPDLQGRRVCLSQFRGKSHVVLMFGNLTCGATVTQLRAGNPTIRSLYTCHRQKGFNFFLIYSRETHPGEYIPQTTSMDERRKNALRLRDEEKVNFPILLDSFDNRVRNLYHGWSNGIFVVNKDGVLVFKSAWTYGPEVAQLLKDLYAWERAEARNELVRFCYSERIVGLLRDKKISSSVHRRAGPQAAQDFARLLKEEGKRG
jgi:AhpC/TSA family